MPEAEDPPKKRILVIEDEPDIVRGLRDALEFEGVPKQTVMIMQGVIVLSVVIAYELVRRGELPEEPLSAQQPEASALWPASLIVPVSAPAAASSSSSESIHFESFSSSPMA